MSLRLKHHIGNSIQQYTFSRHVYLQKQLCGSIYRVHDSRYNQMRYRRLSGLRTRSFPDMLQTRNVQNDDCAFLSKPRSSRNEGSNSTGTHRHEAQYRPEQRLGASFGALRPAQRPPCILTDSPASAPADCTISGRLWF